MMRNLLNDIRILFLHTMTLVEDMSMSERAGWILGLVGLADIVTDAVSL